jgi:hypothetical protein
VKLVLDLDQSLTVPERRKSIRKQLAIFALTECKGNKSKAAKIIGHDRRWIRHVIKESNLTRWIKKPPLNLEKAIIKLLESGVDPTNCKGYRYGDKELRKKIDRIITDHKFLYKKT